MNHATNRAKLEYIAYHPKYDRFITRITMQAMQKIFTDSTGFPLTEEFLLEQLKATDVTLVSSRKKLIGYYCSMPPRHGHMYLGSIILTPAARSKGYGSQIVRHIEQDALARGIRVLDGHVQTANQKALAFWQSHGFRIAGPPQAGSIPVQKTLHAAHSK